MATTAVKDVMTEGPTAIASDAMVVEAARRMLADDVGSLPVVDGETLVGMVTDRDLVLHVIAKDLDPHKVPVADVCSEDPWRPCSAMSRTTHCSGWRPSRSGACRS